MKAYHFILAWLACVWYGAPSSKMVVIGITGTKGKTTTANLLADILSAGGGSASGGNAYTVGVTSSVYFRFGDEKRVNNTKQGMPGRFYLQRLLAEMVRKECTHAVIETTSEGMLQYRHHFIDYRMAVFTNLSPEHIERHEGFEKYRDTKVGLFRKVALRPRTSPSTSSGDNGARQAQGIKDGIGIYNLDDLNVEYFLKPQVSTKIGFSLKNNFQFSIIPPDFARTKSWRAGNFQSIFNVKNVQLKNDGSEFDVEGQHFKMPLVGEFNVYNAAAAVAGARALGISLEKCAEALKHPTLVSGRFEIIQREPFAVVVDYAHEPRSLEEAYKAASLLKSQITSANWRTKLQTNSNPPAGGQIQNLKHGGRLICLLGSQGGGRDRWKRAEMGKVAARYCDEIILTNEDPYDESPQQIIDDVESGLSQIPNPNPPAGGQIPKIWKIIDRKEAIRKAISLAEPGDVVVLTGKGGEVWMCVQGGKKIPWDETKIVKVILEEK